MKALKALVIGMGVIIVLGMVVVIATIISRIAGTDGDEELGTVYLGLPESCRIADVVESRGHLVLRLSGPAKDGCGDLLVVNAGSGAVVGRITPGAEDGDAGGGQAQSGGADR